MNTLKAEKRSLDVKAKRLRSYLASSHALSLILKAVELSAQ